MDHINKIHQYRLVLTTYLQTLADERNHALGNDLEYQVVTDQIHDHYQLIQLGWSDKKFIFFVLLHFDIKQDTGKIWLQQNNTEVLVAQALTGLGVPASDIVLGFKPEYMRPHTGYAVA
jgi:XisI protein